MKKTTKLREILKEGKSIFVPGCYNALSAKILDQVGFPAIYMTGYGTSLSLLGMPDAGFASMSEMHLNARYIANAVRGVSQGFRKELELHGGGLRAQVVDRAPGRSELVMKLGYCHDSVFAVPPHLSVSTPTPTTVVVFGTDGQPRAAGPGHGQAIVAGRIPGAPDHPSI